MSKIKRKDLIKINSSTIDEMLKKINDMEAFEDQEVKKTKNLITEESESFDDEYLVNSNSSDATFVELAIINSYLYNCFKSKNTEIQTNRYRRKCSSSLLFFKCLFWNRLAVLCSFRLLDVSAQYRHF